MAVSKLGCSPLYRPRCCRVSQIIRVSSNKRSARLPSEKETERGAFILLQLCDGSFDHGLCLGHNGFILGDQAGHRGAHAA